MEISIFYNLLSAQHFVEFYYIFAVADKTHFFMCTLLSH